MENKTIPTPLFFKTIPSMFDELFQVTDCVFNIGDDYTLPADTIFNRRYPEYELDTKRTDSTLNLDMLSKLIESGGFDANAQKGIGYAKEIYQNGLPNFPASDIYLNKEDDTLNFELALPGYDLSDISIEFEEDFMLIQVAKDNAMKRRKTENKDSRVFMKQGLKNGSIHFKVPVPVTKFKVTEAKASYINGLLKVVIPKAEAYKSHKMIIEPAAKEK